MVFFNFKVIFIDSHPQSLICNGRDQKKRRALGSGDKNVYFPKEHLKKPFLAKTCTLDLGFWETPYLSLP